MKKSRVLELIIFVIMLNMLVSANSELNLARRNLHPSNNAFNLWTNALSQLKWPEDGKLFDAINLSRNLNSNMPEGEALRQLHTWLDSNNDALVKLRQGIALNQLQFPAYCQRCLHNLRFSAFLLASQAKIILARGMVERLQFDEAAREITEVLTMGRLIEAADGAKILYMVGLAVQSIGLKGVRWLAANLDVPSAVLSQMLDDIPIPEHSDVYLAQAHRVDFAQFAIPFINRVHRESLLPTNYVPIQIERVFDVSSTIALFEEFYARLVNNALGAWPDRDRSLHADVKSLVTHPDIDDPAVFVMNLMLSFQSQDHEARTRWEQLEKLGQKQPNVLGSLLVGFMLLAEERIFERSVRLRTETNLTRAFVALQLHWRKYRAWPNSLSEVRSTGILADEAIDLFDGNSIRYSRSNGILWSVGPDETDNEGNEQHDIVILLPNHASEAIGANAPQPQR